MAVWPLEFLQSSKTPTCRYFLKISGKLAEAANITLLFPQLSMSSQCSPALISSCTMSTWPLKDAQCKGLGLISLVEPITTVRYSGLTSRYCCAAPLEIISLTILVKPRQQPQMKAVHFFLLFSILWFKYIRSLCLPCASGNALPLRTSFSWRSWWVFRWGRFCFCRWFPTIPHLPTHPKLALPLPISGVTSFLEN